MSSLTVTGPGRNNGAGSRLHTSEGAEAVLIVVLGILLGAFCRVFVRNIPRLKFPYTASVFMFGIGWGTLHERTALSLGASEIANMSSNLFLFMFLPSMTLYMGFSTKWVFFRSELFQALTLATLGAGITCALTGVVMHYLLEPTWNWATCLLLGSILANTNPVAVLPLMRMRNIPSYMTTVLEAESLLNSGSSIVLFDLFFGLAGGSGLEGISDVSITLVQLSVGAVTLGAAMAVVVIWLLGRVRSDDVVEIALVFAPAYVLYFVAQFLLDMSGVLAVVTYGLFFPWWGNTRISPGLVGKVDSFLHWMSHTCETLIFTFCGIIIVRRVGGAFSKSDYIRAVILWLFVILIRFVMLVILSPLLRHMGHGFGPRRAMLYAWSGLRGAVCIALALSVEFDKSIEDGVSKRILGYTAAMTILTLLINAPLTQIVIRILVRGATWESDDAEKEQFRRGVVSMMHKTLMELHDMRQEPHCGAPPNWNQVQQFVTDASRRTLKMFPRRAVGHVYGFSSDDGSDTVDVLAMKQGRLLFLRAVQESYLKQESRGGLRWSAASLLKHITDAVEDSVGTSSKLLEMWIHDEVWGKTADDIDDEDGWVGMNLLPVTVDRHGMRASVAGHSTLDILASLQIPEWLQSLKRTLPARWPFNAFLDGVGSVLLMDRINALDGMRCTMCSQPNDADRLVQHFVAAPSKVTGFCPRWQCFIRHIPFGRVNATSFPLVGNVDSCIAQFLLRKWEMPRRTHKENHETSQRSCHYLFTLRKLRSSGTGCLVSWLP
eukprot:m.422108 g.422108  ORF g.422108 m.422108 type:complete len:775 (-) comp21324_c0_seq6:1170-3494(-)